MDHQLLKVLRYFIETETKIISLLEKELEDKTAELAVRKQRQAILQSQYDEIERKG